MANDTYLRNSKLRHAVQSLVNNHRVSAFVALAHHLLYPEALPHTCVTGRSHGCIFPVDSNRDLPRKGLLFVGRKLHREILGDHVIF